MCPATAAMPALKEPDFFPLSSVTPKAVAVIPAAAAFCFTSY